MEDYWPCTCKIGAIDSSFSIDCFKVTTEEVKEVFESTAPLDLNDIELFLYSSSEVYVDKDTIANRRITNSISFYNKIDEKCLLKIHSFAFFSSRDSVTYFWIVSYDLSALSFDFLSGFNNLELIYIINCYNFNISSLPPLPKLTRLWVANSTVHSNWAEMPKLVTGLESVLQDLMLFRTGLNDMSVDTIFEWILAGPSRDTLKNLNLNQNKLTCISPKIKRFTKLETITLENQEQPGLGNISTLSIPDSLTFLNLRFSFVTAIPLIPRKHFLCKIVSTHFH